MNQKRLNALITFAIYASAAAFVFVIDVPLSYYLSGSMALMSVANPLYILYASDKNPTLSTGAHMADLLALYGVLIAFSVSGIGIGENISSAMIVVLWLLFALFHKKLNYETWVTYMLVFSSGAMFGMDLYFTAPFMIGAGFFMLLTKTFKPETDTKLFPVYHLGIAIMFALVPYSIANW